MLNPATLKLIGYGVGALAVIALLAMVNGWRVERDHLRAWQVQVLSATREASGVPKLSVKEVPLQIRTLGQAIADAKESIDHQNAAIRAMAAASAKAQDDAKKAISSSKERVKAAQAQSDRLTRSASDPARENAPCEPSDALTEAWR